MYWRLAGLLSQDRQGCVLDRVSAVKLFGTEEAEGRWLRFQGKDYQIRKVLPWKQRMFLTASEQSTDTYNRVFVKRRDSKWGDDGTASYGLWTFRNSRGKRIFTGDSFDGAFAFSGCSGMGFMGKTARMEQKKYSFRQGDYWILDRRIAAFCRNGRYDSLEYHPDSRRLDSFQMVGFYILV